MRAPDKLLGLRQMSKIGRVRSEETIGSSSLRELTADKRVAATGKWNVIVDLFRHGKRQLQILGVRRVLDPAPG